jgi:UDP-2,3-diacylglucosamine pyrophosphatase LpxH
MIIVVSSPSEALLVFSDVHLGSDLDDCQGNAPRRSISVDHDLVELLAYYRRTPPEADRWHIVIAGDFIDFIGMAIAPSPADALETELTDEERLHGLGGAADHARQKLRRVVRRHADVFAALAAFVADGHALTVVHGNHDIELYWEEVQEDFRAALVAHARSASVAGAAALDEAAFRERIGFNPWFFWRDGVAYIEHGHQYDPFCSTPLVMAPLSPLDPRRIARGFCDVLIRYVVRPTRGMSENGHEHVGLFHYIRFGARLGVSGMAALGLRFARAVRELFRLRSASLSETAQALRREHERRVAKLAARTRIGADRLRALLALQAKPVTSSVRGILESVLLDRLGLAVATAVAIGALVAAGVFESYVGFACVPLLAGWFCADRWLSRRRSVDPAMTMAERATHLAKLFPAAFVVMGHTHIPTAARAGEATYINVGSWAENDAESERAARTHLVIHVTETGPHAEFCAWEPGGPRRLPT